MRKRLVGEMLVQSVQPKGKTLNSF